MSPKKLRSLLEKQRRPFGGGERYFSFMGTRKGRSEFSTQSMVFLRL